MRFHELTNIMSPDMLCDADPNEVIDFIKQHCMKWVKDSDHNLLYRGLNLMNSTFDDESKCVILGTGKREQRKPIDTPQWLQNMVVDKLYQNGIKANRDNSIFTSGDNLLIKSYGTPFVVIPLGNFEFSWSPKVNDFFIKSRVWGRIPNYEDIGDLEAFNAWFENLTSSYKKDDLVNAIKSFNEVLIHCDKVLYIEQKYFNDNMKEMYNAL